MGEAPRRAQARPIPSPPDARCRLAESPGAPYIATERRRSASPAERKTRYEVLRDFGADASADPREPLDDVRDPDAVFGSYASIVADERFRYEPRDRVRLRLATS